MQLEQLKKKIEKKVIKNDEYEHCKACDGFGLFSPGQGYCISKDEDCVVCNGNGILKK